MSDYLPAKLDLPSVLRGDTFPKFSITGVTVDGAAPTSALAGVQIDFRTSPGASTAALSLSTGSGITIDDAAAWAFSVDAFTVTLDAAVRYYFDIETTDAAGTVRTYAAGSWFVGQDVTRS